MSITIMQAKTFAYAAVAAIVSVAITGCSGDATANTSSPLWTVAAAPALEIDTETDPMASLGDVNGVARLPDGSIVVADRPNAALKFFDADGKFVRAVGKNGTGPGEFGYLATMLRCGDSLFVNDITTRKMMVFSANGEFVRQFEILGDTVGQLPYHTACSADGVFINNGWDRNRTPPAKAGPGRGIVPYWTSTATGAVRNRLGQHAWSDRWMTPGGSGPLPLGRDPVVAASRSHFYIGTADSFHINVYALDGAPQAPIQKSGATRATTAADIERYKMLDTLGKSRTASAEQVRYWNSIEFPEMLPAYTAFVVDSDDNLWVRSFPPADGGATDWTVFSPDGAEIAHLALPQDFAVYEIGRDWVLGALADFATGLKRVQVLSLKREKQ